MNEAELKQFALSLNKNLNTLREREAKYGGNAPLELLNQIEDHQTALNLVKARVVDEISAEEFEEQLAPLNLALDRGPTEIVTGTKVAVSRSFITIGSISIPTLPLILLVVLIGGTLIFLGVNFLGPTTMQGRFNVAVAEFGELTDQGVQASDIGERFSLWVFQDLQAENEQSPVSQQIEIWHDSLPITVKRTGIGVVSGTTPEERAAAAGRLAQRIGADVVIYGHLASNETPANFVMEFYVSPRLQGETHTTIGRYQLGDPIPVPARFDPEDPLSREAVAGPLATRTSALFWLVLGLKEELLGRSEKALEVFQQAETALPDWSDEGEGKETLYFFIGRSALFLNRIQDAQEAFEKALSLNPNFARAEIALGSVFYKKAQCRLHSTAGSNATSCGELCQTEAGDCLAPCASSPETCLQQVEEDLNQTITHYQIGLELAETNQEPQIDTIAHLALGTAYRLQGETFYYLGQDEAANESFLPAIREVRTALEQLSQNEQHRFLGQAYLTLGATYAQQARILQDQGDVEGSVSLYEKSRENFQNCMAQQDVSAYYDQILIEQIINTACKPYDAASAEAIRSLNQVSR